MILHAGIALGSGKISRLDFGQPMKVIIVSDNARHFNTWVLDGRRLVLLALLMMLAIGMMASLWRYAIREDARAVVFAIEGLREDIESQKSIVFRLEEDLELNLRASAIEIARLESRMARIDALGQRLTELSPYDVSEFDFVSPIGVGGLRSSNPSIIDSNAELEKGLTDDLLGEVELSAQLASLSGKLADRSAQLDVLERLMLNDLRDEARSLVGKPVSKSWVSSNYGMRTDPISGERAWHNGIDIASTAGAPVVAMAPGVITYAGHKAGYGKVVEINHGAGLSTLYAHQKALAVETGAFVRKGQKIGEVGSTGRSTGPHVHYEIHKDGRSLDPARFVFKAAPRSSSSN